jgi:hypothetical protein
MAEVVVGAIFYAAEGAANARAGEGGATRDAGASKSLYRNLILPGITDTCACLEVCASCP